MARTIDNTFQFIDILGSSKDEETGTILLQTGDVGTGFTETDNVEHWQQPGFYSMPPSPIPGKSATQACVMRRGDTDICLATREIRGQKNAGNLRPGETMMCATGATGDGQARILLKDTSSINLYTAATPGAKAMGAFLDPASDTISLLNSKGYGVIIGPDGVTITAGDCSIDVNADGTGNFIGKGSVVIDGSNIKLGAAAVAGINSALAGVTGIAGVASLKVFIQLA